jgi:hypothetical protein
MMSIRPNSPTSDTFTALSPDGLESGLWFLLAGPQHLDLDLVSQPGTELTLGASPLHRYLKMAAAADDGEESWSLCIALAKALYRVLAYLDNYLTCGEVSSSQIGDKIAEGVDMNDLTQQGPIGL